MSAYPNAGNILSYLPNRLKQTALLNDMVHPSLEDSASFLIESVTDAEDPLNPLKTFGEDFSEKFGIGIAPNTFPFVLEPGQAEKIEMRLTPLDAASTEASKQKDQSLEQGINLAQMVMMLLVNILQEQLLVRLFLYQTQ